ncbi:MAG: hypothetical protein PHE32_01480 [Candidatus Shapirobacteria bacterium]|nr:hypothetical protein [Candidatus Shapirobacteria bacterium]MDD4410359.1 hypothetical protein [Candidatus Shapirobacteria bacterium]
MPKKIIKKEKNELLPARKTIQVSLVAAIIFSLLLAGASLAAGVVLMKIKLKIAGSDTAKLTSKNVFAATKANKPQLDFYVMSFCPYGNQMETTLRPIFDLLGNKVEIKPRYIFEKIEGNLAAYCKTSSPDPAQCDTYVKNSGGQLKDKADCQNQIAAMVKSCNDESKYLKIGNNLYSSLHGRIEANQDVREICAYNLTEDKKLWWDFVKNVNDNCTSKNADTCWEEQAQKAGYDTNKIKECFNKDAASLIEKEIADTTKYKIQGSPSLMIGDQVFPPEVDSTSTDQNLKIGNKVFSLSQTRTPDVIKEALCSAFNKAPKECKTVLEDPNAAAAADSGAAPAANCN